MSTEQPGKKEALNRGHGLGKGPEARRLGVHVGWKGAGAVESKGEWR